jgi:DNA adenine methylase
MSNIEGEGASGPSSTLKWVGGKRRLSKEIVSVFPDSYLTYFEPFLGGASVYLEALPAKAKLSDLNGSLINYYLHLRDNPALLMEACLKLEKSFNKLKDLSARKDFYLKVRTQFNSDLDKKDLDNAAKFLFLNKTAFNGMYRENSRGEFNVPFNNKENLKLFEKDQFLANSRALKSASLSVSNYREAVSKAKRGDLVYFDPPYIPLSTTAAFVDYTKSPFGPSAQEELRDTAKELVDKGVTVILSNSYCETVEKLYKGFELRPVEINRLIAADGKVRGRALEYLIIGKPRG